MTFQTKQSSSFINAIRGNIVRGTCSVAMNGRLYIYEGVSRRALLQLRLVDTTSLGLWFNKNVKDVATLVVAA